MKGPSGAGNAERRMLRIIEASDFTNHHEHNMTTITVGRNGNLLLNLPVDRRGLVHENEAATLRAWRTRLDAMFADDLMPGAVTAAPQAIDGDDSTFWRGDDDAVSASLEFAFAQPRALNMIMLREPIALGQRVKSFAIDTARS